MNKLLGGVFKDLPRGTVTFLFTDIEGSTQLLKSLGEQYVTLLTSHHQLLRAVFNKWNGQEVDTEGDAFFVSFPRATEAVAAAAEAQRALAEHTWPQGALVRVRMGLHTGEPWLVEEGYMGMDVHRAARIGHVGHGGQVLLSETTTSLVLDELPDGVSLLDLGRHRLKDMRRPEHIHQLVIEGLPAEFPPLNSLEVIAPTPAASKVAPTREDRQVGPSPYRGLAAFREADAALFFGREAFTEQLAQAVRERDLVAVIVGPSGSGKSSTVFAGLLPRLRSDSEWLIVETRPGNRPFFSLIDAILPSLEEELTEAERLIESQKLAEAVRSGELPLFQVINRALMRHAESKRMLLVIDQFEELFTLRPDPKVQRLYLDELLAAAEAAAAYHSSPLVLLLTLRADFMGQALAHRPLADALQEGTLILGPMNREELQTAVEKPADLQGAAFESGLVQRILDDVGHEPGNLPLLEFALTLLWEQMEDGWMSHAAYEEIGRVDGALARYAEEVYSGLQSQDKEGARRLFVQLVQPGEGTEDTRRVARQTELAGEQWALVQHLADRRLVVTGRDEGGEETAEVVHEALIRGWERLRTWMGEDRAFRTWQEGLRIALRGWEASDLDEGALLRGAPLAMAMEWTGEHKSQMNPAELAYIEESRQESQRQVAEEEARRQRELDTARQLAETEKARAQEQAEAAARQRRRSVYLAAALVVAVLLAAAAVIFARQSEQNATVAEDNASLAATQEAAAVAESYQRATAQAEAELERKRADEERDAAQSEADLRATAEAVAITEREIAQDQGRLAFSRELAAAAQDALAEDQELAVLLAIQALDQAHTQEAEDALHRTVQDLRFLDSVEVSGKSGFLDISPDGRLMVSSGDGGAAVWDIASGEILYSIDTPGGWINHADFSPDGSLLVLPNESTDFMAESTVSIYEAATGEELLTFVAHDAWVQVARFSPDGNLFATAGGDGVAKVWDLAATLSAGEGKQVLSLPPEETILWYLGFSPDGKLLATINGEDLLRVWDLDSEQELWQTPSASHSLAFNSDGTRLITGVEMNTLDVLDASTGQRLARTLAHEVAVNHIQFSPDGTRLASAGNDSAVKLWAFTDDLLVPLLTLTGHKDRTVDVDFTVDGEKLVSTSQDGKIRFWDVSTSGSVEPVHYFHGAGLNGAAISPDGSRIATAGADGITKLWDADSGKVIKELAGGDWIWRVAFTPDGRSLATAAADSTVRLWDAGSGQELTSLTGLAQQDEIRFFRGIMGLDFSPDGRQMVTAGGDGSVRLWDVTAWQQGDLSGGDELAVLNNPADLAYSYDVSYSLDGRWIAATINTFVDDLGNFQGGDGIIKVWDTTSEQLLWLLTEGEGLPYSNIAFSPDGSKLAAGHLFPGLVTVWQLPEESDGTPEILFTIDTSKEVVFKLSFSPDGTQIAVPHSDGMSLWDAGTGEIISSLPHDSMVLQAVYSPDGDRLLTAGFDGAARLFIREVSDLVALAQSRLTRTLTTEECQKYLHADTCPTGPS